MMSGGPVAGPDRPGPGADLSGSDGLEAAAEQWRTEGWALVDGLVPEAEIAAARAEIESIEVVDGLHTRPSRSRHAAAPSTGPAFRADQFTDTTLFPFHDAPRLNRLVVNDSVIDFAKRAMLSDDLRIYQSRLWSKYADRVNYEQPLHLDLNHSLVPTRSEPGWWHLESFLYLTDVDDETGAPRLVPRSRSGGEPESRRPTLPDDSPALYAEEVSAVGRAGSLLVYRSDVWHRGVDIVRPGAERHVLVIAFKPAGTDWIGYDPHPPLAVNPDFISFVADCTPDELALFGVPEPGHAYWTADMVDAMATHYPGLDVDPWRGRLPG